MKRSGFLSAALLIGALGSYSVTGLSASNDLPSLGDATSSVVSQQQEYDLGRQWLKVLRSQTPMVSDAQLKDLSLIHI